MKLSLRHSITLLVVGAYLIFSYGFMLVRFPPVVGGGVPIGEILLFFSLCFLAKDVRWIPFSQITLFLLLF